MKLEPLTGGGFSYYCPGCKYLHSINTQPSPRWEWNGNLDVPTFTPSIRVRGYSGQKVSQVCHHFITKGQIQFLSDSTHELSGQTVPLPDIPEEWL